MVDRLYIYEPQHHNQWQFDPDIEYIQWPWHWLEIFHPFTGVKNLYLSKKLASSIAPILQELIGRRTMEVFPVLQSIFSGGTPAIGTYSGRHSEVCSCATALRSPYTGPITVSISGMGLGATIRD